MNDSQRKQIKRLREEGYGYGRIAQTLGLSENTIKTYCRRHGLGGVAVNPATADEEIHYCLYCGTVRKDSKHRVLRRGESIRANGKYQFKYHIGGKPHFVYSWRLEPTDPLPVGKKPCLSLRELEKQIGYDLDNRLDPLGKNITVNELVERYLRTKVGMRPNILANYNFVRNILKKESFGSQKISKIKTSDAKLFLIKMQQEDGRGHSTIKTVRGVLRPAFQMAVDDDVLMKNPFQFELAGVVVNDAVTREAITKDQMRKFLKVVHEDVVYCKYYEVIYILFHTGMRISEFVD